MIFLLLSVLVGEHGGGDGGDETHPSIDRLQDCVCISCNASLTAGKVYRNNCYFINVDANFKVDQKHKRSNTDTTFYRPTVVNNRKKLNILKQVIHSVLLRNIRTSLVIKILVRSNETTTTECYRQYRRKSQTIDCENYMTMVMTAPSGRYRTLPNTADPTKYETCLFNDEAVASRSKNVCFTTKKKDEPCEAATLATKTDLRNVFAYLFEKKQFENEHGFEPRRLQNWRNRQTIGNKRLLHSVRQI